MRHNGQRRGIKRLSLRIKRNDIFLVIAKGNVPEKQGAVQKRKGGGKRALRSMGFGVAKSISRDGSP